MDMARKSEAGDTRPTVRTVVLTTWRSILAAALIFALAVGGLRWLMADVDSYRGAIEARVSALLGHKVRIGSLRADLDGWRPVLHIEDVRLLGTGQRVLARFSQAEVGVDLLASLGAATLVPGRITVRGATLRVTTTPEGGVLVDGLTGSAVTGDDDADADATAESPDTGPVVVSPETSAEKALGRWFLTRGQLDLERGTVIWQDLRAGGVPVPLTNVQVSIRNDGTRHRLAGSATLPQGWGQRLALDLDIDGDPLSSDWSGTMAFDGEHLALRVWPRMLSALPPLPTSGTASFSLQSSWTDAKLQQLHGQVTLEQLEIRANERMLNFEEARARILLKRTGGGWGLDVDQLNVTGPYGRWPETRAILAFSAGGQDAPELITGELGYLRIHDVLPVVMASVPSLQRQLAAFTPAEPEGILEQVTFTAARGPRETPPTYRMTARFRELGLKAQGKWPGIRGLSGALTLDESGGSAQFDTSELVVDTAGLFREPIRAETARGTVAWQRTDDGWRVKTSDLAIANADLSASARGQLLWSHGDPVPLIDLEAQITGGRIDRAGKYLPEAIMPKKAVSWLNRALTGGRVTDGRVIFKGRATDFPFDKSNGRFEVRAHVTGGRLDYADGWPILDGIEADVHFLGRGLKVTASAARIANNTVTATTIRIADLDAREPLLQVNGETRGNTRDGLNFLRTGPLSKHFVQMLPNLEIEGPNHMQLALRLPLKTLSPTVSGSVQLAKNRLYAKALDVELLQVNGKLGFTESSVTAKDLDALFDAVPVKLSVSREGAADAQVRISMTGHADPPFITRQLARVRGPAVLEAATREGLGIEGATAWRAQIDLSSGDKTQGDGPQLQIESDLKGLGIHLPAPLGKSPEDSVAFTLSTTLGDQPDREVHIRYGDARARLAFELRDNTTRLAHGDIQLGGVEPALPSTGQVRIHGNLSALSLDDWARFLAEPGAWEKIITAEAPGASEPSDSEEVLPVVALNAGQLTAFGNHFTDVRLEAERIPGSTWALRLAGDSIDGSVFYAPDNQELPLVITLEKLRIDKAEEGNGEPDLDPRQLPALRFSCAQLTYGDLLLGNVALNTRPSENGLELRDVSLATADFEANARGHWEYDGTAHRSRMEIEAGGKDLARFLKAFGYEGADVEGGDIEVRVNAVWPGSPAQFKLQNVNGILQVNATRGRLLDLRPGASRLFGLLTLTSLPRRLKGDFSDLFDKGFSYDRIEGSFSLDGGNAYTNNMLMDSPSARIEIAGRTGFIAEDYDQVVTVTPKLSSSLPVAGALLGPIGIGVGAVVWLAEKVLGTSIVDRVASYQYTVTGSWDDPVVERVQVADQNEFADDN
ncbi:MAG: TIGR02099 family protein [Gammaproteobacteria bacterium]|nr:MAG: TIGR02099 family protein [Gammaproteobacteria bacterium]